MSISEKDENNIEKWDGPQDAKIKTEKKIKEVK